MPDDSGAKNQRLRVLPQVQRLIERAEAEPALATGPRVARVEAARATLAAARQALAEGASADCAGEDVLLAEMARRLRSQPSSLRHVINATGVVLHTNLGRAPMAEAAALAAAEAARAYTDLEFDLSTGERGARGAAVEALLCEVTGAEAALAVNNAAAAVLLALSALAGAHGGEVIVSRGELVEIGGGFRIPEVIAQGGARLVEVGTTNRTRLADYAAAIGPATRVLLKVHQSNYRLVGFTEAAALEELAALARAHDLLLVHDLGGGALLETAALAAAGEPTVQASLQAGADLVALSGDKLMGGPQAGLLVGSASALAPLRRHPLLRAVRLDKMTLAALEATLRIYRDPDLVHSRVPVLAMIGQTPATLRTRAEHVLCELDLDARATAQVIVEASEGFVGGGALPGHGLQSFALAIAPRGDGVEALARRLRASDPPVIARIAHGRLWLDMLAVTDREVGELARALEAALRP